jgi:hypothetical protein
LDQILSIAERTEHAVAVKFQFPAERFGKALERLRIVPVGALM